MEFNIKCIVSYDGTCFGGFQIQRNVRSVQEEIQLALFKICKEQIKITGAGRTDKGVHAYRQCFNFKTSLDLTSVQWKSALNSNLPHDIHIVSTEIVDDDFHARFSAKEKQYSYYMNLGEYDPLKEHYMYQLKNPNIDLEAMYEGSKVFLGEHDFRNFCSNKEDEVKDFIKTIYSFDIVKEGDIIRFTVRGSGFLRYQVRMMVGTLIAIGQNKVKVQYIIDRIDKKEAIKTSFDAPSMGLYLEDIKY